MSNQPIPMDPIEEQFREDYRKTVIGEMTGNEFGAKFPFYEQHFGKEKFDELFSGKPTDKVLNLLEAWVGFEDLKRIADEEWVNISSSLRLDNDIFIGKFLVARLKVEHVLNRLLFEHYSELDCENKEALEKTSFSFRLSILPKEGKLYRDYIKLLHELNDIRNKLAHDLSFDIDEYKIEDWKIKKYGEPDLPNHLSPNIKGELRQEVLLSLLDNALFYLLLETEALKVNKMDIISKNQELKDWFGYENEPETM